MTAGCERVTHLDSGQKPPLCRGSAATENTAELHGALPSLRRHIAAAVLRSARDPVTTAAQSQLLSCVLLQLRASRRLGEPQLVTMLCLPHAAGAAGCHVLHSVFRDLISTTIKTDELRICEHRVGIELVSCRFTLW